MNQRAMIAAAAASLMSLTLVTVPAAAHEKEKCFGICQSRSERLRQHFGRAFVCRPGQSGHGQREWKYVAKGTCKDMKGLTMDEAKMLKKG